ncbi:MAG: nucleotidyltransferase domain-containing protein [Clostridium sp.]|nr:nucleotidyltransferase domain-containing protein [Clostridium sp.]
MKRKGMLENSLKSELAEIFSSYPQVIAVYLFGSYLDNKEQARDIDLAVLLKHRAKYQVDLYMDLYPRLALALSPLEPDLLFFHEASLPVRFEVISTGEVLYSSDEELRTDIEYIVSGEYLDFKFHLEMSRQELFEAIKEETPLV